MNARTPQNSGGVLARRPGRRADGFTMIEIALSLAIIGFALVAIIGILPYGLGVQQENTNETVINHDASVLMDAVCNGQQGLDDLTNYVASITNYQTIFNPDGSLGSVPNPQRVLWYLPGAAGMTPGGTVPFPLVNGNRIVGLLSTPKYVTVVTPQHATFYVSNHVVATIRSMSGLASDKAPQANGDMQSFAFTYRLTSEVVPLGYGLANANPVIMVNNTFPQDWTNYTAYTNLVPADPPQWISRSNNLRYALAVQQDEYDVRLLFRWPANGQGNVSGRQANRGMASGPIVAAPVPNEYPTLFPASLPYQLYFAQPNLY
jgi:type II secretory pathway pseudopilin PulG